jgi:TatD DNase family protein
MPPQWRYTTAAQRAAGQPQGLNTPLELPRIGAELAALRGETPQAWARRSSANALSALPRLAGVCEAARA